MEPAHTAALLPRGHPGDLQLPVHRPEIVLCHQHEHPVIQRELRELSKSFIIDATHLDKHSLASVRGDVNRALKRTVPFDLSHLHGSKYLLRFGDGTTTSSIPSPAQSYLDYEGYLYHQWIPSVGSTVGTYSFKVWLDIIGAPPHLWSIDELVTGVSTIGILLDHAPLHHVSSFERFGVLVAATPKHP
jgi:Domain of unknown function (DUF4283)